jgi:hypothetical protein
MDTIRDSRGRCGEANISMVREAARPHPARTGRWLQHDTRANPGSI